MSVLAVFVLLLGGALSEAPRHEALRSALHSFKRLHLFQTAPDSACQKYILSTNGIAFGNCIGALQFPQIDNTTCMATPGAFDTFCLDSCYTTVVTQMDYIISSGVCYDYLSAALDSGCKSDTDCDTDATCYKGSCEVKCTSAPDCFVSDPCASNTTTCIKPSGATSMFCDDGVTTSNGQKPGLKSFSYQLKLLCTKDGGKYCGEVFQDGGPEVVWYDCPQFEQIGCCGGSILNMLQYCNGETVNNPALYKCNNSKVTCTGLPQAQSYCSGAGTIQVSLFALVGLIFAAIFAL